MSLFDDAARALGSAFGTSPAEGGRSSGGAGDPDQAIHGSGGAPREAADVLSHFADDIVGDFGVPGLEVAANAVDIAAESLGPGVVRAMPLVGNLMSAAQMLNHGGRAVYDGLQGDRDGAINHGVQAAVNGAGMIPLVNTAMGAADLVLGSIGLGGRIGMAATGAEGGGDLPTGIDDLLAGLAVLGTNAVAGRDDTNLIAEGSAPTGTDRGESAWGMGAMIAPVAGVILPPFGALASGAIGALTGHAIGEERPTDGAQGSFWSRTGQAIHGPEE